MDDTFDDHEAEDSISVTGSSLDLIDGDDEPKSNHFDLPNVKSAEVLDTENDLEHESNVPNDVRTGKGSSLASTATVTNYSANFYDGDLKEDDGKKKEDDGKEKEDEEYASREVEETLQVPPPNTLRGSSTKILLVSDVSEGSDEMEMEEMSMSDDFRDTRIIEDIPFAYSKEMSRVRLTQSRIGFVDRTTSILEKRLNMIGSLKELLEERRWLKMKNNYLHRKCCQLFEKSTMLAPFESLEGAAPIHEDERYENVLEDFMMVQTNYETTKPFLEDGTEKLTNSYDNFCKLFDRVFKDFIRRESEIGSNFVDDKGKRILKKMHSLTKKQNMKIEELSRVRVLYLKYNNNLKLINTKLRRVNHVGGEGETLMDYEQLLIAHTLLMDKMDERDEELRKLRGECTRFVTISSHMKETSDALIYDVMGATSKLNEVTEKKRRARKSLVIKGTERDSLRKDTLELRYVACLLEKPAMLRKMHSDSRLLEALKLRVKRMMDNEPASLDFDNFMSRRRITL